MRTEVLKLKTFVRLYINIRSITNNSCSKITMDLEDFSKEDLIYRIRQLEAQVRILKNTVNKKEKSLKYNKPYDFSRYKRRHVLLKFLYLGWDYHGYAGQEENIKTIENELFKALKTTRLIESVETANYNRCGRTDSGVSAFSQVISIDLRSNLKEGRGVFSPDNYNPIEISNINVSNEVELPYCKMLNQNLPKDIRIWAWAPIDCDFSARFDCHARTYKYYFVKGDLNIKDMEDASKYFIGAHDFRNICKMNVKNSVINYERTILNIDISPVFPSFEEKYQVYELTIKGYAFLWHQIRYMVAVLFLVGQGKESPEVIKELLDVEKHPRKPQYSMAIELPLVFYDCEFEDVIWQYDNENTRKVILHLQRFWTQNIIKSTIIKKMIQSLESNLNLPIEFNVGSLICGTSSQNYTPLLKRNTGDTLEEKIEKVNKKKKFCLVEENT